MSEGSLRSRPEFWPVTMLSIALIAVLAGWSGYTYIDRTRSDPPCSQRTTLRVAAAPSIAPPIREIASRLTARDECLDLIVEERESADVLRAVARTAPDSAVTVSGSASASPAGGKSASPSAGAPVESAEPAPDVWVPESTLWLRRARSAGAFGVPAEGISVATSPVVLALDQNTATRLAGKKQLTWPKLVGAAKLPVPVALPDPATSPLGFGALVGIRNIAKGDAPGTAAIMRRLSPYTVSTAGEAVPDPAGPGKDESAVISTEQQVLFAADGGKKQVAVYPGTAVPGPDYPYAVITAEDEPREYAATLLRAMLAANGASVISAYGLRTPSGAAPAGVVSATKIRTGTYAPAALPSETDTEALLNAWGGVHISARMLAVFDISGSMAAVVPGSSETRMQATVKAAQDGVKLLLPTTELGIWEFSTDLDGKRDYREVIPVGPIGPRREELIRKVGRMEVEPNGHTGLYDTALAAYRDATRNWTPGRINMVLILTDGTDDNASGLKRPELLRELGRLVDRKRPLPILFIGVGPEIDAGELNQIAKATGGQVALTEKPSGIRQIFYTALAEFSCLPPRCRR
ncbi:substrate-binding and VWA domain-containing protein [Actinoplanes sichuanensis]|uniref:Substrate-binding and VWA domain-containing protein n=1 Tax=Actinoplanes sichuanensis TaxID=512349 RepID=A0ABW4AAW0_9ACTN|nr:substrate-binding domain-containing protein [Actinoplanes sichuanensis]BEL08668.1 substrate-binding and VWA domain-containing protein [Actinoplanes sichuanensis]